MHYKLFQILLFMIVFSCVSKPLDKQNVNVQKDNYFLNKGFALIYKDDLFEEDIVKGKIEERSLVIFQKNLKKNTSVKVTNLINSKYVIAKVGKRTAYPYFYNSVISKRISDELLIDEMEPYIEIKEIIEGSSFIVKKAKTYEEEKKVADKAPVDDIQIKDLGKSVERKKKIKKKDFNYIVKIADFYFENSAIDMKKRIFNQTSIKNIRVKKLSDTKFRVFIGPYDNLNSLKKSFNAIKTLEFDNIEIIKN